MTRRAFTFRCEGSDLVGTLDDAPGASGLLLISGGNELRSGAWAGQAQFAARIAAAGYPVLRFDRRGIGDSEGANGGFRSSAPDIAAARDAFLLACPALRRVVGFGNCDAASALMLGAGCGLDALVLSNPWVIEHEENPPPPAAVREHYRRRLRDPAALKRLLTGQVSPRKLAASLHQSLRRSSPPTSLAQDMASGLASFAGQVRILIADRDRTAQTFLSAWATDSRILRCPGATHSYVEPHARDWLVAQVLEILRG